MCIRDRGGAAGVYSIKRGPRKIEDIVGESGITKGDMALDAGKGLGAQVMLHLAGVDLGHILRHAQADEEIRQQPVALIDAPGDLLPLGQEGDVAVVGHGDVAVFPQLFHSDADAGLGHPQVSRDVDGADDAVLLPEHEDGLEIILGGFINVHCKGSFPALRAVSGGKKCRLSPKAPPGPPLSLFPLTHSTTNIIIIALTVKEPP